MKKLTVLMPVYNGRLDWVEGAVSSILNQSFRDFNFLIINDGSNQEMTEFLMSLPSRDGRIKILNNDGNKGLVYSLNRGLEESGTEWVARMDADDWAFPHRLEVQMDYLENSKSVLVLGTKAVYLEDGKPVLKKNLPLTMENIAASLPFYCCICHPTVILNRKAVLSVGGYPNVKNAEDYALWLELLRTKKYNFINLDSICLRYRRGLERKEYRQIQVSSSYRVRDLFFNQLGLDVHSICRGNLWELHNIIVSKILLLHPDANRSILMINADKFILDLLRSKNCSIPSTILEYQKWKFYYLWHKFNSTFDDLR